MPWTGLLAVAACVSLIAALACSPDRGTAAEAGAGSFDDVADVVLGQPDMAHAFANRTDAFGIVRPTSVAVDTSSDPHILYVVDSGNHRVLAYRTPLPTGHPVKADLVLGQPDFQSASWNEDEADAERFWEPLCVAVDSRGNVYVSDVGYHRVLQFDRPFENDARADRVFGQHNRFETLDPNEGGVSADSLFAPGFICVDPRTDDLWVADTGNNRVVCYRQPLTTDTTADFVLGQPDLKSAAPNAGGLGAGSLHGPMGVTVMGRDVVVADSGNRRVLVYERPLETDAVADHVIGQDGSFSKAEHGCSPFRLEFPTALMALENGNGGAVLLVADSGNHRMLMFARSQGFSHQPVALWGQGASLHTAQPNAGGLGPAALAYPMGMAIAPDGMLWVADSGNHRVLGFEAGIAGDRQADRVIGQIDLKHGTENLVDAMGLANPRDVAVDRSVQPNRLYVCDSHNNRILAYASVDKLGPQAEADLIIGQPDRFSNSPGGGRQALFMPTGLAVDARGNLFVADRDNSRVLCFERPFETDTLADRVFGQADFSSNQPNAGGVSARSLHRPESVVLDGAGNLYVADTRNHRVLRFDRALETDAEADAVWGQLGKFTTGQEYASRGVRADTLSYPFGIDISEQGLLAIADANNHRVLVFDTCADDPLKAIKVVGQAGRFETNLDNLGDSARCSANSLSGPEGVAFRGGGLFVSDTANCRLLWYESVRSCQGPASAVYGQFGSFESNQRGMGVVGARNLWFPSGLDFDSEGNLYVADREQSRVLVFQVKRPLLGSGGRDLRPTTSAATGGGSD